MLGVGSGEFKESRCLRGKSTGADHLIDNTLVFSSELLCTLYFVLCTVSSVLCTLYFPRRECQKLDETTETLRCVEMLSNVEHTPRYLHTGAYATCHLYTASTPMPTNSPKVFNYVNLLLLISNMIYSSMEPDGTVIIVLNSLAYMVLMILNICIESLVAQPIIFWRCLLNTIFVGLVS